MLLYPLLRKIGFLIFFTVAISPVYATNPPDIVNISPTSGSTSGGTVLTISGFFFYPNITVDVGGSPCIGVNVNQSYTPPYAGTITCTTPPHNQGFSDVVVTNANTDPLNETNLIKNGFQYIGPDTVLPPSVSPLEWRINQPVELMVGPGSFSGSFVVDLVSNRIISVDIVVNGGVSGGHYNNILYSDANLSFLASQTQTTSVGMPVVSFTLAGVTLPSSPSTVTLNAYSLQLAICSDPACANANIVDVASSDFQIVGVIPNQVPTLSEWSQISLMLSLICLMGWYQRRAMH